MKSCDNNVDPLTLQDLIEKVVLLCQAVRMGRHEVTPMNHPLLVEKLRLSITKYQVIYRMCFIVNIQVY